jgi:hypothetical protein
MKIIFFIVYISTGSIIPEKPDTKAKINRIVVQGNLVIAGFAVKTHSFHTTGSTAPEVSFLAMVVTTFGCAPPG